MKKDTVLAVVVVVVFVICIMWAGVVGGQRGQALHDASHIRWSEGE